MTLVEGLRFLEIHGLRRLRFPSCWRIVDTMRARAAKADEARTEAVHHARADQVVAAATTAVTVNREAVEAGRLPAPWTRLACGG